MADETAPHGLMRVEQFFTHVPHPRLMQLRSETPARVRDPLQKSFNGRLALWITNNVGTMWCAYLFAVIGIIGIVGALSNSVSIVLIIGAISGYFLQLVLLPIIIVGQNLQASAADARSEHTYKDAEAILNECVELQQHLQAQDRVLDDIIKHIHALPGVQPS